MPPAKVRLYVEHPVGAGQTVPLDRERAHYLCGVMRLGVGDQVLVFDQNSGEWLAEVTETGKKTATLACVRKTKERQLPSDVWFLFAPIKKERTDFIVEKATELGAAVIQPVKTEFTNTERINLGRLLAHAIEATEQCGGTVVPDVRDLRPLDEVLTDWPEGRKLMFCDESLVWKGKELPEEAGPWAILVGPEGGFSAAERARLEALPFSHPVSLGPRVLRADTAAVAALTMWQMRIGGWR